MTTIHGFELIKEQRIPELNTQGKLYRHVETGAELLSLENDDENKVFGVAFRTPPPDSTGLPHIMEHAVLCGSRKYPVKEPFVELMKGSLKTFLNALTYADKTCYPVASQNLQDFYNLVDVYLDAVFYPRNTLEHFQQEGWRYELGTLDDPLTYKGIVFNEMKGAYSSPDDLVARYSEQAIFPDNVYFFDAGGDPQVIPNLTYEQYRAFHETYYHPSNARLFFSGNDDPEERLRLVQAYLKDFGARPVDSTIAIQPSFDAPRRVTRSYPAGEDVENQKALVTVNWLLLENTDPALTLSLEILAYILVGIPASPLRKALIDAGLGEDVIGVGLSDELRQLYFSTGLKGVNPMDVEKVEKLILDTLSNLAENGIDSNTVDASVNTIEFALREQNFGAFPRGVVMMLHALTTWLYDRDPFAALAFEAPLAELKTRLSAPGSRYFEELIQTHLLQNPHRATLILAPDPELRKRQEAAEQARLAAARESMTETDLLAVMEATRRLKKLQETPDTPEALATIPALKLEDLDKEARRAPTSVSTENGVEILYHDLFTNGIVYVDAGFNLHALPQDLLPYASLLGAALLEIGTETEDFVKLTQRIGRKTGGIRPATFTSAVKGSDEAAAWLFLRGKATVDHTGDLLDILRDILLTVKLDNKERLMQMLLEKKAREESLLLPEGHRIAAARLRSRLDEAYWAAEQLGGVSYLFFLRQLAEQVESDWPAVLKKLEEVRRILVNRHAMICNVTVDAANWAKIQPQLSTFLAALPAGVTTTARWSPEAAVAAEGLTIPATVNYVAKGAKLYDLGYTLNGSIEVIAHYLRLTWLWERVRARGGAYGSFCIFDQHSGIFGYVSYRDPNLLDTLNNYDQTSAFLRRLDLAEDERVKSIIGVIGTVDAYQLPDAKGYSALLRHLIGYTDEDRQKYREEILSATTRDFKAFADVLDRFNAAGLVVVLGSQEAIEAASTAGPLAFKIAKVL